MKFLRLLFPLAVAVAIATSLVFGTMAIEQWSYAAQRGANRADREMLPELSQREQLSKLFRVVAKTVKPAVVEVRVKKKVSMPDVGRDMEGFKWRRPRDDESPFARPPAPRRGDRPERYFFQRGLGSGVIVDAKKGYVLTNYHVVRGADEVEIVLHDERKFDAEWVRSDADTDLAVVKIKGDGFIDAPLGDSDKVEVGDWVLAIGAPERLPQTVTAGIISAKGRTMRSVRYENFLQTDAAINHGNSGGPLVNMLGEVIGINAAIVSRTGVNEGIGLAIPSNMARNIMRQLIAKGRVVRGYLGVNIQDVDEELAKSFNLPGPRGALVTKVIPDTPAAGGGIKEEDFITAINGKAVKDVDGLRHLVAGLVPGDKTEVTVYREGDKETLTVTIGELPTDLAAVGRTPPAKTSPGQYGLEVRTLTKALAQRAGFEKDVEGVLVTDVAGDSDAAEKGVARGMVIDRIGDKEVRSAEDFAKLAAAAEGKPLRLRVATRQGVRKYIVVALK